MQMLKKPGWAASSLRFVADQFEARVRDLLVVEPHCFSSLSGLSSSFAV